LDDIPPLHKPLVKVPDQKALLDPEFQDDHFWETNNAVMDTDSFFQGAPAQLKKPRFRPPAESMPLSHVLEDCRKYAAPGPAVAVFSKLKADKNKRNGLEVQPLLNNATYAGVCCAFYPYVGRYISTFAVVTSDNKLQFWVLTQLEHPQISDQDLALNSSNWTLAKVNQGVLHPALSDFIKNRRNGVLLNLEVSFDIDGLRKNKYTISELCVTDVTVPSSTEVSLKRSLFNGGRWTQERDFLSGMREDSPVMKAQALSWLLSGNVTAPSRCARGPHFVGHDVLVFPAFRSTSENDHEFSEEIDKLNVVASPTQFQPQPLDKSSSVVQLERGIKDVFIEFPFGCVYRMQNTKNWFFHSPLVKTQLMAPTPLNSGAWRVVYRDVFNPRVVYLGNGTETYQLVIGPLDLIPKTINVHFQPDENHNEYVTLENDGNSFKVLKAGKNDPSTHIHCAAYLAINRLLVSKTELKGDIKVQTDYKTVTPPSLCELHRPKNVEIDIKYDEPSSTYSVNIKPGLKSDEIYQISAGSGLDIKNVSDEVLFKAMHQFVKQHPKEITNKFPRHVMGFLEEIFWGGRGKLANLSTENTRKYLSNRSENDMDQKIAGAQQALDRLCSRPYTAFYFLDKRPPKPEIKTPPPQPADTTTKKPTPASSTTTTTKKPTPASSTTTNNKAPTTKTTTTTPVVTTPSTETKTIQENPFQLENVYWKVPMLNTTALDRREPKSNWFTSNSVLEVAAHMDPPSEGDTYLDVITRRDFYPLMSRFSEAKDSTLILVSSKRSLTSIFDAYMDLASSFNAALRENPMTSYGVPNTKDWFDTVKQHRRDIVGGIPALERESEKNQYGTLSEETKGKDVRTPLPFFLAFMTARKGQVTWQSKWMEWVSPIEPDKPLYRSFSNASTGSFKFKLPWRITFKVLTEIFLGSSGSMLDFLGAGNDLLRFNVFDAMVEIPDDEDDRSNMDMARMSLISMGFELGETRLESMEGMTLETYDETKVLQLRQKLDVALRRPVPFVIASIPYPLLWAAYCFMYDASESAMDLTNMLYPLDYFKNFLGDTNGLNLVSFDDPPAEALATYYAAFFALQQLDHKCSEIVTLWFNLCAHVTSRKGTPLMVPRTHVLQMLRNTGRASPGNQWIRPTTARSEPIRALEYTLMAGDDRIQGLEQYFPASGITVRLEREYEYTDLNTLAQLMVDVSHLAYKELTKS